EKEYDSLNIYENEIISIFENKTKYEFSRYGFGIKKDMYFLRNYHLAPFVAYSIEQAKLKDNKDETSKDDYFEISSVRVGADFGRNITHNFQIIGSINYNIEIDNVKDKDGNIINNNYIDGEYNIEGEKAKWTDLFKDRGGVYFSVGIRILL
ncbi:MAG: hypothetical protein K8S00_06365, partial [Bacteroidales bacterium]|nr:hypothetical protein [Bacteroidales bacterium]